MSKKGIKAEDIIRVLEAKAGFVTQAASALGITYQGLYKRIKNNKKIRLALDEINERKLDFSESKLFGGIKKGQPAPIIFHLKCKGKQRGWVERQEITGAGGGPVEAKITVVYDENGNGHADLGREGSSSESKKSS